MSLHFQALSCPNNNERPITTEAAKRPTDTATDRPMANSSEVRKKDDGSLLECLTLTRPPP
jgi:hypothetical protein